MSIHYTPEFIENVWSKVSRADTNDCWMWTVKNTKINGIRIHRIIWEIAYGNIPKGHHVRHICNSKLCCNPAHLYLSDPLDPSQRFWKNVNRTDDPDECWEWNAFINERTGYGAFGIGGRPENGGRSIDAHRACWEIVFGSIPDGLWVLHRCDNRKCVNPNHLFLGTHQDNMTDMKSKNRGKKIGLRGEDHPDAKLTWEKVRRIRIMFERGEYTQSQLSRMYGVGTSTMNAIVRNRSWRE